MNEIVTNLPFEEYAARPGISASLLKLRRKSSLAHVKACMDGKLTRESDALDFGKAFHSMLLEDKQEFVIHPLVYPAKKGEVKDWNWNANYCKEWASAQSLPVMSHDESDDLVGMVSSLKRNPDLAAYLNGDSELSLFAEMKGIKVKARLDTVPIEGGPILDFKSTTNAEPSNFVRQAYDAGYFLQAAFYLDVLKLCGDARKEFWFVAIEKTYPYASSIIKLSDGPVSFLEMGRQQYRSAMTDIEDAYHTGRWPSFKPTDAELVASPWMLRELEEAA